MGAVRRECEHGVRSLAARRASGRVREAIECVSVSSIRTESAGFEPSITVLCDHAAPHAYG